MPEAAPLPVFSGSSHQSAFHGISALTGHDPPVGPGSCGLTRGSDVPEGTRVPINQFPSTLE